MSFARPVGVGRTIRTDDRDRATKASPEASYDLASRRGLSEIDGRMVYLWRAVDAEGEVLDVLVQSKRNRHAALKLMRKLFEEICLRSGAILSPTVDGLQRRSRDLGIEHRHERGRWKNNWAENSHQPTRRRERKMQGFKVRVRPRNFFPHTPPSTMPSTSNVISPQPKRTARFAPRRSARGGQSQRPNNS